MKRLARWGHSMTTVVTCSGLEDVVIFGGSPGEFGSNWRSFGFPKVANTVIYSFGTVCGCVYAPQVHTCGQVCNTRVALCISLYSGHHGDEWVLLDEHACGKLSSKFLECKLSKLKFSEHMC